LQPRVVHGPPISTRHKKLTETEKASNSQREPRANGRSDEVRIADRQDPGRYHSAQATAYNSAKRTQDQLDPKLTEASTKEEMEQRSMHQPNEGRQRGDGWQGSNDTRHGALELHPGRMVTSTDDDRQGETPEAPSGHKL
jgi:hypothetical protein